VAEVKASCRAGQAKKQPGPLDQVGTRPRQEEFGCQEESSGVPGHRDPLEPVALWLRIGAVSAMRSASAARTQRTQHHSWISKLAEAIPPRSSNLWGMRHRSAQRQSEAMTIFGSWANVQEPMLYRVRICGHLDPAWTAWFDELTLTQQDDGTTELVGRLSDQSALYGLLARLRDLGATLLLVEQLPAADQFR
jgi:hypothetical protein